MQGSDSEAEDGTNEQIAELSLCLSVCLSVCLCLCLSLLSVKTSRAAMDPQHLKVEVAD